MPEDIFELVGQYDYGLKCRLYEIVNRLVNDGLLTGASRPDYVYDVGGMHILPPIMYPSKLMNAAVNFYTHACEGCTPEELAVRTRERQENRGVPYLFLKPTRGAIIGTGDDIIMPFGRDEIVRDAHCGVDACTTGGWSGEVGVIRSLNARSIVRPYGGAGLGLREMAETGPYISGRAGIDFTPRQSPLTVRAEGRYHRFSGSPGSVFLLNTGIRFAIGG